MDTAKTWIRLNDSHRASWCSNSTHLCTIKETHANAYRGVIDVDSLCQLLFLVRFGHASSCQMDFNVNLCHNHDFCSEGSLSKHSFEAGSKSGDGNEWYWCHGKCWKAGIGDSTCKDVLKALCSSHHKSVARQTQQPNCTAQHWPSKSNEQLPLGWLLDKSAKFHEPQGRVL